MNALSTRVYASLLPIRSNPYTAELQASSGWQRTTRICGCCSQRKFLFAGLKRAQGHSDRLHYSTGHSQTPISRALSTSRALQDDVSHRKDLPSQAEGRRSHASKRFDHLMDSMQSKIFIAGQRLNDLTGYSGIESLKNDIERQEIFVQETRTTVQRAREAYAKAISQRSTSQREVNELLQRKHAWSPTDLERFTELYRSDHANEQAEATTQNQLTSAEKTSEEAAALLSKSILARYHEEQIWSDKIRRMSTWGTWGLMGVNVLLFLLFQVAVEPWRRKRLVKGFEEKVLEALEKDGSGSNRILEEDLTSEGGAIERRPITDTVGAVEQATETNFPASSSFTGNATREGRNEMIILDVPLDTTARPQTLTDTTFARIKEKTQGLFSDRQILLRQIDLTTAVLEGAVTGMLVAGLAVTLLRFR